MRTLLLASLVLTACGTSHGPAADGGDGDAGVVIGDCPLPAPTGCTQPGPGSCCESVPAVCRDGAWVCNPSGVNCEGACGGCDPLLPNGCFESPDGMCCGDQVGVAACVSGNWTCPAGALLEAFCAPPGTCAPSRCESLGEAQCIGAAGCAPVYDDACCAACTPTECADCSSPQMLTCVPTATGCAPGAPACEASTMWGCTPGAVADCAGASPVAEGRCSERGCVVAIDPTCPSCPEECVPVTGGSCTALCDSIPPNCPLDLVPEADGSCWTGRCIPPTACLPDSFGL